MGKHDAPGRHRAPEPEVGDVVQRNSLQAFKDMAYGPPLTAHESALIAGDPDAIYRSWIKTEPLGKAERPVPRPRVSPEAPMYPSTKGASLVRQPSPLVTPRRKHWLWGHLEGWLWTGALVILAAAAVTYVTRNGLW